MIEQLMFFYGCMVLDLKALISISTNKSNPTFLRGLKEDIFLKWNSSNNLGNVWPGPVYFPDFLNPNTSRFWANEISTFRKTLPVDGLWIDMNEISSFMDPPTLNSIDDPPYKINNSGVFRPLNNKTVPVSAIHYGDVTEYNAHNLHGLLESIATHDALIKDTGKRPFVLTRSTFVGSGKYVAHWTGDNHATWDDLEYSIPSILSFGLFGLGAFYPFSRAHSAIGTIRQELYLWDSVATSAKKVLSLRYQLLPYFYTQMYRAHMSGAPIARPLFFSFPQDISTYDIHTQFLIGNGIMVSPVVIPGEVTVNAYFPKGMWFNMFDYSQNVHVQNGTYVRLNAPDDAINVHVHGGKIIPMQRAEKTTELSRNSGFELLVVFDETRSANGELYLDDGESIEAGEEGMRWNYVKFESEIVEGREIRFRSNVFNERDGFEKKMSIEKMIFLGLDFELSVSGVVINGNYSNVRVGYGKNGKFVAVEIQGLKQLVEEEFEVVVSLSRA
ncbi:hypothetical protein LUZ60_017360 [Juncus effusus]|nr:hypothetical protein LUZ60_017360 [Juncus effusus]